MAGGRRGRGGGGGKLKLGCETSGDGPMDGCDVGQWLDKAGEMREGRAGWWSSLHFRDGGDSERDDGGEW